MSLFSFLLSNFFSIEAIFFAMSAKLGSPFGAIRFSNLLHLASYFLSRFIDHPTLRYHCRSLFLVVH